MSQGPGAAKDVFPVREASLLIDIFGDRRLLVFVPSILFQVCYTVSVLRLARKTALEIDR